VGINTNYSYFLRFKNNEIHDCGESGIQTIRSGKLLIEGNKCWNNSWTSTFNGSGISVYQNFDYGSPGVITNPRNYQNIIRGNACWGNANFTGPKTDGNGIIIDDTRNLQNNNPFDPNPRLNSEQIGGTLVENNICTANGARGINVFSSSYTYVINNTCHDNATVLARSGAILVSWSKSVVLKNNIAFARTGQNAIEVVNRDEDPLEYPTIQNCVIFNGPVCTLEGRQVPVDSSNVIGDPKFTNPGVGDYTLQSSSPAIDVGNVVNTPTNDINGNLRLRGNAVDAGAHESALARTYPSSAISQYIEAESASAQGNFFPFIVGNDASASGGAYLTATSGTEWYNQYQLYDTPGLGTNAYHRAEYNFSLPTASRLTTVNIWIRVRRVAFTGGTLFASIDSGLSYLDRGQFEFAYLPSRAQTPAVYLDETNWTWVLYRKVKLASGNHTFKLAKGEKNVQVDRIFITSNLTATP
jgi:parallel beta-helix repeat protein